MPQYAYMNNKEGNPIDANRVPVFTKINKPKFFCCTKNCMAEMILCKHGTGEAYFKSKNILDHLSNKCIKNSIVFKESSYNENLFDKDYAFESILGIKHSSKPISRGNTGSRKGNIGGSRNCRIHTLPLLYAMCLSKGKAGNYNGVSIDDMLADDENYNRYKNGITGYKIVETSKYYEIEKDFSFMMNYPADNRVIGNGSWVKVTFDSKALFEKYVDQLKNSSHIEPVIIAGDWKLAKSGSKHHSECIIHKASQIYFAKEGR